MSDEKIQKKYIEFQIAKQQMGAMAEHKASLEKSMQELTMSIHALRQLEKTDSKKETFVPMGSGVLINAAIQDTEHVLVAAGAGVVIKKKRADAVVILSKRLADIQAVDAQASMEIQTIAKHAATLEEQLQRMIEKSKK